MCAARQTVAGQHSVAAALSGSGDKTGQLTKLQPLTQPVLQLCSILRQKKGFYLRASAGISIHRKPLRR